MDRHRMLTFSARVCAHLARPGILVLILFLALGGLFRPPSGAQAAAPLPYAPDSVLVGLKPGGEMQRVVHGVVGKTAAAEAASYSAIFPGRADGTGTSAALLAAEKLGRLYRLRLPAGLPVPDALAALRLDPSVEFAEPDYLAEIVRNPNDPLYPQQWGLARIEAPAAWDVTTGQAGVTIAIIDSGIDLAHPDLAGKLWTNLDETPGNGIDDDGNGKVDDVNGWNFLAGNGLVGDENGHGTQVAGVLGAKTENGAGIAGLCWGCRLMVLKVVQPGGTVNYSDIAAAISYAVAEGAQVINLSLGGYADSETLRTAVESAAVTAVVVGAAGNDGLSSPFYPAAYPDVLAVAATDSGERKADFSNYGEWVDIAAPGVDIYTTLMGGSAYGAQSGSSLAAPFASGLAGLLRSAHPDWSPGLVRQQITNTAVPITAQNPDYPGKLGSGRLNAGAALTTAPQEKISLVEMAVDGQPGALPAPGTSFDLALTLLNEWLPARGLVGTLSETDSYATVQDALGSWGDLNTLAQGSNAGDSFRISLAANTPYRRSIPFTLTLSGEDGFALVLNFTLSVRSGTYEISGDVCDQTWTSDRQYVLKGNTFVSEGCTLTIQPGVMIHANPGVWMRVDGTLAANGTAEAPITFTANSPDGAQWSGLRFVDSSVAAQFDGEGNYLSGSILRYVRLMHAETGVKMTTKAPYLAHSTFANNGIAVDAGTSSPRIEHNTFEQNGTSTYSIYAAAIYLDSGQAYISQNLFRENGGFTMGRGLPTILSNGGGVSAVVGNTFTGNTGTAMALFSALDPAPMIRGNRVTGNGGGFSVRGFNGADISGNLFSGNLGNNCEMTPCSWGGGGALTLDVQGVDPAKPGVLHNTIVTNASYGLLLSGPEAEQVPIHANNWQGNQDYDVYLKTAPLETIDLDGNYWGGLPANQAESRIYDCGDTEDGCSSSAKVGNAVVTTALSTPDPDAPAFVLSATVNPDPLGIQTGVFEVNFSRPMDPAALPRLSFHDSRRGTVETIADVPQSVGAMAFDIYGRLWVGNNNWQDPMGVRMYDGQTWTTFTKAKDGLAADTAIGIYSALNGDLWVAHSDNGLFSRYSGGEWEVHQIPVLGGNSGAITEDAQGRIWVGTGAGAFRYENGAWEGFDTEDGLLDMLVDGIARDGQGRMWFSTLAGLSSFDGAQWEQYRTGAELPKDSQPSAIFADSQGRIWIGLTYLTSPTNNTPYAGMFDGDAWYFYTNQNTGGLLSSPVIAIAESPNGEIWMVETWMNQGVTVFSDGMWLKRAVGETPTLPVAFDLHGNFWMGPYTVGFSNDPLRVLWGGDIYSVVDNEQWLSPIRYQATYEMSPLVPKGTYILHVEGAVGEDGMEIAPDASREFTVDYAGTVVDSTPPSKPIVTIDNSSQGTISFRWSSSDPQGILQYRYCLGTGAGRCDVQSWTYVPGGTTSISLTGLLLTKGQTYYITVAAQNTSGLWSAPGTGRVTAGVIWTFLPYTVLQK